MRKQILFIVIVTIIIALLPIPLNFLILRKTDIPVAENNDWIGFFGSYLGAIIGGLVAFGVAFVQIRKQKEYLKEQLRVEQENFNKQLRIQQENFNEQIRIQQDNFYEQNRLALQLQDENNRSYINMREFHNVPMDLNGIKIREDCRIIETKEIKEFQKNNKLSDYKTTFFVITHHGNPNIIHNCKVEIECSNSQMDERYQIKTYIGSIYNSEEVFIPLYQGMEVEDIIVISARIEYFSINGEHIVFHYDLENFKETYSIVKDGKESKILSFDIGPVTWIYPNKKVQSNQQIINQ
jgi:hypothetical protein